MECQTQVKQQESSDQSSQNEKQRQAEEMEKRVADPRNLCRTCKKDIPSKWSGNRPRYYCNMSCRNIDYKTFTGNKSPSFGMKHSEETKNKIRIKKIGIRCSPDTEFKKGIVPSTFRGFYKHSAGYRLIFKPEHPNCTKSGYVFEHRLIMENKIGRLLNEQEVVHHINGIKDDNNIDNLKLFRDGASHIKYHMESGYMTPEGKIKSECSKYLSSLLLSGDIIYYQRINSGKIKSAYGSWVQLAEKGHFDFIVLFNNKEHNLSFAFIEVKRSDKVAKLDPDQVSFKNKYEGKNTNVYFWLVQSGKEVSKRIMSCAYDRMKDITL